LSITGDLFVAGQTITLDAVTLTIEDKNIVLGAVSSPSDLTANGGGITLSGTTDKILEWRQNSTGAYKGYAWNSSESINLINTGLSFNISGQSILTYTNLGSSVTGSYLKTLGTIVSGTWNSNPIGLSYGGTAANLSSLSDYSLIYKTGSIMSGISPSYSGALLLSRGSQNVPVWSNTVPYLTVAQFLISGYSISGTSGCIYKGANNPSNLDDYLRFSSLEYFTIDCGTP
jgi:hypothetical protein